MGTKRGRRHLVLEADRRVRARAAAILWSTEHSRHSEFPGFLAPHPTGERIRCNPANRYHDALGTEANLAVSLAAATGPQQPGVPRRPQRSKRDGQPL